MYLRTETLSAELLRGNRDLLITGQSMPEYIRISTKREPVSLDDMGEFHVVEGDLLVDNDELLIYTLRKQGSPPAPPIRFRDSELVGISFGGRPVRWDEGLVLSYCVLRKSFPSDAQYVLARDSLAAAAAEWESACNVHFAHRQLFDGHLNVSMAAPDIDPSLVFTARYLDVEGQFIASAFFPTHPPSRRKVLFDPSYFVEGVQFDRTGVLRHELGHVLGFRHEHIRDGAPGDCVKGDEENAANIYPFGEYDRRSVMHYFCGGAGDPKLILTEQDKQGAAELYGPSKGKD